MPNYAGPIKFPVPADRYNTAYGEPQWWKELAETAAAAISAKADVGHSHSWAQITGKPTSFTPAAHTHAQADVTGLSAALTSAGQTARWADVSGKPSVAEYRRHATGTFNANDAAEGVDLIRTTVTHSNLPRTGGSWALKTEKQAGDLVWQEAASWGLTPEVWRRIYGSYWSAWVRVDAGAVEVPEIVFPAAAPSQSVTGFKTVPVALTVGGGVHDFPAVQGGVRIPVNFSVPVKRWRLHLRNINPRQGEPGAGSMAISSVYIGRHGGNGTVSGGNTLVGGAMASSDGSDMVTPWTSTVIDASFEYLISYGWTSTQQPKQVVGGAYTTATVDGAFSNTATATRSVNSPLDAWIEAEVEADVPVVAGFGDSLTSGVGAALPVFNSWLTAYCRTHKALPVHYSASGDTMAGWSDPEHYKWTRWEDFTRPDAVVHAMGSNDVFGGASLAEMQARFRATVAILAEKVTPVIHAATIMPREGSAWDAMEQVRRDYNAWLAGRTRELFDFVGAVSLDDETLIDSIDADGIHLTAAGYVAVAGAITRPLASTVIGDKLAALTYDSGLRDITALAGANITGGQILLRRTGKYVTLEFVGARPASTAGSGTLFTVPTGFRKPTRWDGYITAGMATGGVPTQRTGYMFTNGGFGVNVPSSSDSLRLDLAWITNDPIPTTPPGSAA